EEFGLGLGPILCTIGFDLGRLGRVVVRHRALGPRNPGFFLLSLYDGPDALGGSLLIVVILLQGDVLGLFCLDNLYLLPRNGCFIPAPGLRDAEDNASLRYTTITVLRRLGPARSA